MSKKNDIGISRRKILAGLGTIGVASAGAGLGTSAYFSDTESFEGNIMTAGELDLSVSYDSTYNYGGNANDVVNESVVNGSEGDSLIFELTDVKPGDKAAVEFCFKSVNNPAYLWFCGQLNENNQNSINDPEQTALDQSGYVNASGDGQDLNSSTYQSEVLNNSSSPVYDMGEWGGQLAQKMEVSFGYSQTGCNGDGTEGADVGSAGDIGSSGMIGIKSGNLSMMANGVSIPLDGVGDSSITSQADAGNQTAFNGSTEKGDFACPCLRMELIVPSGVGNQIQSDIVRFAVGFAAYQDRHNDGTQSPCGFDSDDGDGDNGFGGEGLDGES